MGRYGKHAGFTIIELVIVIAILGIFAAVSLPRVDGITDEAKKAADVSSASTLAKAYEMYEVLYGHPPTPKELYESRLIDKAILKPQYDEENNSGYYVIKENGSVSVYYASSPVDENSTTWGTSTGEKLFPVDK